MRKVLGFVAMSAVGMVPVFSQEPPAGPPPVLQIMREVIKEGKGAAHEKTETEFVRAFRKAKFPGHYLALTAMSGMGEVWFLDPYPSFATWEQYQKEQGKEPLKSELETAESHDGALREPGRSMWAVYRKEMSYQPEKLNVGKTRFVTIGTYRIRLGHDEDMHSGAKAILEAYQKASIDATLLCYQVVDGAPSGTYLFFSTMDSLKTMDDIPARQKALAEAMGADNYRQLMKGSGETFASIDSNLFAVSPRMSYVAKEPRTPNSGIPSRKPPRSQRKRQDSRPFNRYTRELQADASRFVCARRCRIGRRGSNTQLFFTRGLSHLALERGALAFGLGLDG